ncbi:MAG: leucyl/phenylalanyl-tRNA--protein transferase [Pirellulales bacterium]
MDPPRALEEARVSVLPPARFFPPAEHASAEGLIGIGGELTTDWLLDAYRHGIFPWPQGKVLAWWSPDPRAVIELDGLHVSRRLARTCRGDRFQATRNRDFHGVIEGCRTTGSRRRGTWITTAMVRAYLELHRLGHAHSVEVWHEGTLAGGAYGVSVGGMFAAESMFYRVRDASKAALVHLVGHLRSRQFTLLDIQQFTPHTARLGAREIARHEFLARLAGALESPATFGPCLEPQRINE